MSALVRRLLPGVAFLAAGLGVAAWQAAGGGEVAPRGVGAMADAPGDSSIPARPRPHTPPETVPGEGACGGAMEALRFLVAAVPSGSLLDEAQNRALTDGLAAVDAACPADLAATFREQEIVPWLTWVPPAAGELAAG